jgi:uncharacterized RDD family membrane protein YckC
LRIDRPASFSVASGAPSAIHEGKDFPMQWYYATQNQRQGPVSDSEFQRLALQGIIAADTLVWRQGMPNWQPYAQIAPTLPPPLLSPEPVAGQLQPNLSLDPGLTPGASQPAQTYLAPSDRSLAGVTLRSNFRYAGFWIRFVAKIIDVLIIYLLGFLASMVVNMFFFKGFVFDLNDPGTLGELLRQEAVLLPLGLLIGISFDLFFLRKYSATPGKLALGLKVIRSDGSQISAGRIVGRYFSEKINIFIMDLGYIIAAFDDEKRALHDHLCDTRVVRKPE